MADALSLNDAVAIIDGSLSKARELNLVPLTIAVVDVGGQLIALKREDNSALIRADLAIAKAWTAAAFRLSTGELEKRAQARPWFFGSLADMPSGKIVPVAGALPIYRNGEFIGAVGATGAQAADDEQCCLAGLESLGLKSTPA
ncbi:MAG: GlcG/HbpS family heme-binding protein [Chloroflexota bacterium]